MDLNVLIGRMAGDYQIKKLLGMGGMGAVFLAWHQHMKLPFAVKVLRPDHAHNQKFLDRFFQEAHLGAQLRHENAVGIHNAGIADLTAEFGMAMKLPYLVMEYVRGRTVRSTLKQAPDGHFDDEVATEITLQTLRALAAAHAIKLIHRDIKPDNLMITRVGVVKVTDFGLARSVGGSSSMTVSGQILGTPLYMSTEQWQGLPDIDGRSDIYSLGVSFYQLLSGQLPFPGNEPVTVLHRLLATEAPPLEEVAPHVDAGLIPIVMRMMAKNRDHRFATATEAIHALEAWKVRKAVDSAAITTSLSNFGLQGTETPEVTHEPTTENRSERPPSDHRTPETPASQSADRTRAVSVGEQAIKEAGAIPELQRTVPGRRVPPSARRAAQDADSMPKLPRTVRGHRVAPSVRRSAKTFEEDVISPTPAPSVRMRMAVLGAVVGLVIGLLAIIIGLVVVANLGPPSTDVENTGTPASAKLNANTNLPANSDPTTNAVTNAGSTANGNANANSSPAPPADEAAFEAARTTDSVDAYRQFVLEFPQSKFVEAAKQRLAKLLDDAAFAAAEREATAEAFQEYLTEYPNGRHATEANRRLAELDDAAFAAAARAATVAAFCTYLTAFPSGRHAAEIRLRVEPQLYTAIVDAIVDAINIRRRVEPHLYDAIGDTAREAIDTISAYCIVAACERYLNYVPDGPAATEAKFRRKHPLPSREKPTGLPNNMSPGLDRVENGFWKGYMTWRNREVTMDFIFVPPGIVCVSPPGTPLAKRQWAKYAGFWMSIDEVSAGDWNTFELSRNPGIEELTGSGRVLPVCGVRATDAVAFCDWLGGRLPTETELLAAMRGFADAHPRRFSWPDSVGTAGSTNRPVWAGNGPVESNDNTLDIGPYGHRHLAGNVREWCRLPPDAVFRQVVADFLAGNVREWCRLPVPATVTFGVWGGSFAVNGARNNWAATFRASAASSVTDHRDIGFRVCLPAADN